MTAFLIGAATGAVIGGVFLWAIAVHVSVQRAALYDNFTDKRGENDA